MCQRPGYTSSEYASGFEHARILNIPEFFIFQDYTEFRICLNNSCICQDMSGCTWTYGICMNMPKSTWVVFVLHFRCGFITFHVVTYFNVYSRLEVIVWRNMRQNLIFFFSVAAGSILFILFVSFVLWLNIFTCKI